MNDGQLYDLMVEQKNFILKLISEDKISEAKASFETVKDLWAAASYRSPLEDIVEAMRLQGIRREKFIAEQRKSFAKEVRMTGR